jgi:hypothetical protein
MPPNSAANPLPAAETLENRLKALMSKKFSR